MASKTLESKRTATAVDMPPADAPIHPAADVFPALAADDYAELRRDIELHGILEPIWVDPEGQVLDGRHRLRAAYELGMTCQTLVYDGPDAVGFVSSMNLHRRHLTESQRAIVAAKLANLMEGRPSKKTPPIGGVSTKAAAKVLHVSPRSVERAKCVLKHGSPEVIRAVESGDLRVGKAAVLVKPAIEQPQTRDVSTIEPAENIDSQKAEKAQTSSRSRARLLSSLSALRHELIGSLEPIRSGVPWEYRRRFLDELSDYLHEADALTRATWKRQLGGDRKEQRHA
jgi:ParB-like chromosome segregation protein Spo0J